MTATAACRSRTCRSGGNSLLSGMDALGQSVCVGVTVMRDAVHVWVVFLGRESFVCHECDDMRVY